MISRTYLGNAQTFPSLRYVACADADPSRALVTAAEFSIDARSVAELVGSEDIDCILDLTPPVAHFEVGMAALRAGKHLYQEKPLAVELAEAAQLRDEADARGLRIGCAPDTFLGVSARTLRRAVDDGLIGTPIGGALTMLNGGPERWHPDPAFLYAKGAGPLFDVGVYHVTAAVSILGPIGRVAAATARPSTERVIASGPKQGTAFPVDIDTCVSALIEHRAGSVLSLVTSFDAPGGTRVPLEIRGTEGTLSGPDPNDFHGTVELHRGRDEVIELPSVAGRSDNARGIGLDEMAASIAAGRPHRANAELAYHVLEVMHAILAAARAGCWVEVESTIGACGE